MPPMPAATTGRAFIIASTTANGKPSEIDVTRTM